MEPNFDIDNIFRETLGNATDVPPSSAWSNISNELPHANPSVAPNTSGNWFSKLGVISKASIVISSLAAAGFGIASLVNQESTTKVVQSEKQIETTNVTGKFENQPALKEKANETIIFEDQWPILVERSDEEGIETISELQNENQLVNTVFANPKEMHSNQLDGELTSNMLTEQSSLIATVKKSDCKHQLGLNKIENSSSIEQGNKFEISGLKGMKQVQLSYGDKTSDHVNSDSNVLVMSHLYKVRSRKVFSVKLWGIGENNCKDSAQLKVEVTPTITKQEEMIPTVFTPNGDGKNDEYFVTIPEPVSYKMYIFDMRKNKIFHSENKDENWKGNCGVEPCANGIYEVILKLKYSGEEEMVITKRINLIRKTN